MAKPNHAHGIFLMLMASVCFAIMAAATKEIGAKLPVTEIVFVRSFASSIVLFWLMFICKNKDWTGKKPLILSARGIIGFIALTLYFWSLPQLHLGTAIMLNYTAPVFAVITSYFIFKEKSSLGAKVLIATAFFGVYLLTAPQIHENPAALLAGLGSGFLAVMVHLLIRQSHDENESPLLIIFYFTVVCAVGSAMLWPLQQWQVPNTKEWIGLFVITVSSFLGQLGLTYSLQKAPVSIVSPFGYITPVIGLVLGFFIWRENPNASGLLGSAVIIFSGSILYKMQT